jgi:Xaa-Pro aminopeptidase
MGGYEMDKIFFTKNREALTKGIEDNSVVILFAGNAPQKSADECYGFTPNRNFYYLTGIDRENIIVLLSKRNGKIEESLFIEESDPVLEKWVGKRISSKEAEDASGIKNIKLLSAFTGTLHQLLNSGNYNNLYLNLEKQSYDENKDKAHNFAIEVFGKYPFVKIKNVELFINNLRTIKSKEEIKETKIAIDITREGIEALLNNARPGMMEYELEAYFDFVLKTKGVKDYAFSTIAASGKNAAILHYVANDSKSGDNDLILFDLGAQYNYYNADISRTFPLNGKFTDRQKALYNIVLKAQLAVIDTIKPGVPFKALNEKCKEVLADGCIKIGLIKETEEIINYYFHGVSHYLGLDTHDVGSRDVELAEGMLLTVEPGLYIAEEGIGIRIEDNVLVTKDGNEVLSKDIIKTVQDIEKFMEKK